MRSHRIVTLLTVVNFGFLLTLLIAAKASHPGDGAAPTVIQARAIELVDGEGNVRAQLLLTKEGGSLFRMRDGKGEVRVKMEASADGAGLLFLDGRTEPAVQLGTGKGGTNLKLTSPDKKVKVIAADEQ